MLVGFRVIEPKFVSKKIAGGETAIRQLSAVEGRVVVMNQEPFFALGEKQAAVIFLQNMESVWRSGKRKCDVRNTASLSEIVSGSLKPRWNIGGQRNGRRHLQRGCFAASCEARYLSSAIRGAKQRNTSGLVTRLRPVGFAGCEKRCPTPATELWRPTHLRV